MHGWILTDLAGGHHLQALLVCADATSGAQVTLVEGTPVWGKVVGKVGVQLSAPSASHHPGQNLSVYLEICSGASTSPKHLLSPTTSAWPLAPQSPAGANPLLDPILQQPWLLTPSDYLPGSWRHPMGLRGAVRCHGVTGQLSRVPCRPGRLWVDGQKRPT